MTLAITPPPMSMSEVEGIMGLLMEDLMRQRQEAARVDSWIKPDSVLGFDIPRKAGAEHKKLAELSRTPWLGLVVTNVAQAMYVDNIVRGAGETPDGVPGGQDPELWALWIANGMDAHQISNHRAMVAYGQSFSVVTPAVMDGLDTARIRCLSPKRLAALWEDPATDVYPMYAVESVPVRGGAAQRWRLYDENYRYDLWDNPTTSGTYTLAGAPVYHGVGVTPVVRYSNLLDLEGNVTGEVTPFIPTAARINKTSYDRLLAQHFNSWKTRTISGIDLPANEDPDLERVETDAFKLRMAHEDILVSESEETKFGVLEGTSLDTYVTSWRSDIEALAAVSQTPAHALTGQLVNLNAEALAAARAPLTQKVWERQINAGRGYARTLRLAASIAGLDEQAADPMVRTTWQDMEIRSMAQAVDALGKAATMLDIPKRGLWDKIPGVEQSDIELWDDLAAQAAERDPLNAALLRHSKATATAADEAGEA